MIFCSRLVTALTFFLSGYRLHGGLRPLVAAVHQIVLRDQG